MEIIKNEDGTVEVKFVPMPEVEEQPFAIPIWFRPQPKEPVIKIIVPRNEVVFVDENGVPQYVEPLTEGETLVEVGTFNDHIKPFYDGTEWVESATTEEIAIARPTQPVSNRLTYEQMDDAITYLLGSR